MPTITDLKGPAGEDALRNPEIRGKVVQFRTRLSLSFKYEG